MLSWTALSRRHRGLVPCLEMNCIRSQTPRLCCSLPYHSAICGSCISQRDLQSEDCTKWEEMQKVHTNPAFISEEYVLQQWAAITQSQTQEKYFNFPDTSEWLWAIQLYLLPSAHLEMELMRLAVCCLDTQGWQMPCKLLTSNNWPFLACCHSLPFAN